MRAGGSDPLSRFAGEGYGEGDAGIPTLKRPSSAP